MPSGYFTTLRDFKTKITPIVERNGGRKGMVVLAGDGGEHTSARGTRYDVEGQWWRWQEGGGHRMVATGGEGWQRWRERGGQRCWRDGFARSQLASSGAARTWHSPLAASGVTRRRARCLRHRRRSAWPSSVLLSPLFFSSLPSQGYFDLKFSQSDKKLWNNILSDILSFVF